MAKPTETKETKTFQRSPKYPAFDLSEAIAKLKILWAKDGKVGSPKDVALKHLGYSSTKSSSAVRAISSLKQYGLTEEYNGRIMPSKRALDILLYSPNDEHHIGAIKDAAIKPIIFSKLYAKYGSELPSDEAIKAELIRDYDFNPNSVGELVETFKNTLKIIGLQPNDRADDSMNDAEVFKDEKPGVGASLRTQFERSWSLKGGIIARLQVTQVPPNEEKEFLKMCLNRALEELFPPQQ